MARALGPYYLLRPDPQALWPRAGIVRLKRIDATYHRSEKGGSSWEYHRKLPTRWEIRYGALAFEVGTLGFKHTGLFRAGGKLRWMAEKIAQAGRPVEVLNLLPIQAGLQQPAHPPDRGSCMSMPRGAWCSGPAPIWRAPVWPTASCAVVDDCMKFVQRAPAGPEVSGDSDGSALLWPRARRRNVEDRTSLSAAVGLRRACRRRAFPAHQQWRPAFSLRCWKRAAGCAGRPPRKDRVDEVGLPISSGMTLPCGAQADGSREPVDTL